ncbi:MAG: sigma-70 family RNA polymerase sigma factor [Clostridia bacterium]
MEIEEMYRMHIKEIYAYLYRLTRNEKQAEDLTQDTFTRAFQYLDLYNGEKVWPWLFKVAYHAFVDWYRKQKNQVLIDPSSMEAILSQSDFQRSPEQQLLEKEVWHLLSFLPDKQRQVLLLRYKHQFTCAEIGSVLGISEADVKMTLHRGRTRVYAIWKETQ